jgi:hypothetical protein
VPERRLVDTRGPARGSGAADTRSSVRFPLKLPITVRTADAREHFAETADISAGGVLFHTKTAFDVGTEIGFRIGVYSDFHTLNENSLRIQGLGLGVFRLTPTMTFKLGAMYLDRNKIKILPAGGLLWTPTPQVRFDFFFPQPKLSAYLTTVGKHELWWYLAGEYGGGAWTIQRTDGTSDRIDINDIRTSAGIHSTSGKP